MKQTIRAKIVAVCDGIYGNYVFQNLDQEESSLNRYITVTKCPNWQYHDTLNVGDTGFLEYESVNAGDKYKTSTGEEQEYNYTTTYFMNFIKEKREMKKTFNF